MTTENRGERVLTTDQAMRRLGMSRGTFFSRLKEHPEIQPVNYNPNLKRRVNPRWKVEDVDKLGTPIHPDDDDDKRHVA